MLRWIFIIGLIVSPKALALSPQDFCKKQTSRLMQETRDIILKRMNPKGENCMNKAKALTRMRIVRLNELGLKHAPALGIFQNAEIMDLSKNALDKADFLLSLPRLKELDLSQNPLEGFHVSAENRTLETLILDYPGKKLKLVGLQLLTGLKHLSLRKAGIHSIAELGELPTGLDNLDLFSNSIEDLELLEERLQTMNVNFLPNEKLCTRAREVELKTILSICQKILTPTVE